MVGHACVGGKLMPEFAEGAVVLCFVEFRGKSPQSQQGAAHVVRLVIFETKRL